jgi:hypothetical protein
MFLKDLYAKSNAGRDCKLPVSFFCSAGVLARWHSRCLYALLVERVIKKKTANALDRNSWNSE